MMLDGWLSILQKQISPEEIEMYMGRYESEDTPRTLSYQLDLMKTSRIFRNNGFAQTF
jgi:hypothetical protein